MSSRRMARVMPTKQRRRSSSSAASLSLARMWGKSPSSSPIIATAGNSSPLAACSVISVTLPCAGSTASASATSAIDSRKPRNIAKSGGIDEVPPSSAGSEVGSYSCSN